MQVRTLALLWALFVVAMLALARSSSASIDPRHLGFIELLAVAVVVAAMVGLSRVVGSVDSPRP